MDEERKMKRMFGIIVAATSLLGAGTAAAIPTTLQDVENVNEWLTTWETASWVHQYTFSPGAASIIDATLSISFWDDESDTQAFRREFAIGGISGSWALTLDEIDTGVRSFDINVGEVADGVLGVWVTSLFGDFGIGTSTLDINYDSVEGPVSVPEPETLGLLGLSLLTFGLVRRRAQHRNQ
jgi:hypothetical protein